MSAKELDPLRRVLSVLLLATTLVLILTALLVLPGSATDAGYSALTPTPGWSDFQPQSWVTPTAISSSVTVAPTQPTNPSASFRVFDGATASWSLWLGVAAIEPLADGYRLTTIPINFPEGDTNKVQFRLTVDQFDYESGQFPVKVDRTPPTVTLTTPSVGSPSGFTVAWTGQDTGSGMPDTNVFDVFYRKNASLEWLPWLSGLALTETHMTFGPEQPISIQPGDQIGFHVSARDQAGIVGWSSIMTTTIEYTRYLPAISRWQAPPPQWTRAGLELNGRRVRDLALDTNDQMILYAASQHNGVYKNTACSNPSWLSIGPDGKFALSVLVDGNVILVGTYGNSLYRWGGTGSWARVDVGNPYVWALAKDSSGKIYAGTDAGVFRSPNHGVSWEGWKEGLSGDSLLINEIWVDSDNVWAATYGGGVYRRPVDGNTGWLPVNTGLVGDALRLRAWSLAEDGNSMLVGTEAGVYRLTGNTWEPFGLPAQTVYALTVSQNGVRYAGTRSGGVFARADNATNWSAMNAGLPSDTFVYDLLISSHCNVIFAATRDGVWQYPVP